MNVKLETCPSQTTVPSQGNRLLDVLERPLQDLRISVIDRCNFRCTYCMPEDEHTRAYNFLKTQEWLSFDEIVSITGLFAQLGVKKLRISGGEPLLRPNLHELIDRLTHIPGIKDLALTTNGSLLARQASLLKKAGLKRVTISLDTLDPVLFKKINGQKGNVEEVLEGIEEASRVNFECVKINVVVQKGVNDHTLMDMVEYFKGKKPILRFIEFMDVGNRNNWKPSSVFPTSEMVRMIHSHYPMEPAKANYFGEVASRYKYKDGIGEVGFISSVTQPFCRTCTRARLSADGKIYLCLFADKGMNLRQYLREGKSEEEILDILRKLWIKRDDRYSELRPQIYAASKSLSKIEMFQIGG